MKLKMEKKKIKFFFYFFIKLRQTFLLREEALLPGKVLFSSSSLVSCGCQVYIKYYNEQQQQTQTMNIIITFSVCFYTRGFNFPFFSLLLKNKVLVDSFQQLISSLFYPQDYNTLVEASKKGRKNCNVNLPSLSFSVLLSSLYQLFLSAM